MSVYVQCIVVVVEMALIVCVFNGEQM